MNVGEEIAAEYLKWVYGCDFVEPNLKIPEVQGEIDVVGINLRDKKVYVCEVAVHLETGLQYVKKKRPDNVPRLTNKFDKGLTYAKVYFPDYEVVPMFWSPIVKNQTASAMYNQLRDVSEIQQFVEERFGLQLEAVINDDFSRRLDELKEVALSKTEELTSPMMRFLQIEKKLARHLSKLNRHGEQ
ncbi:hypothetical protein [Gimesia sp.]|uniref:hypothetical protein n=1 Tax=Gimesia sp. TaxID=2024833 RepID=UPI003A8E49C2